MPSRSDYVTGTISLTTGSDQFTGSGTAWQLAAFQEGDIIIDVTGATEYMGVIASIDSNVSGTLTKPWEGPNLDDVAYRVRYQPDNSRITAQARNLIELIGNGNLQAFAELEGSAGVVGIFTGPGTMALVPLSQLTNGVNFDARVADVAGLAAYDTKPGPTDTAPGFTVLVEDVGDGRAGVFTKASNSSGDWTDPAYVTGPVGPDAVVTVGSVTTLAPGSNATVTSAPIAGGTQLNFGIPAGAGFVSRGAYSGDTAYVKGDVVRNNNSSWIAKEETTGNAPPVLPTTSNTWWELLASKGTDGTGTGDVVGPASAVADRIAVFDGTTGKLLKDGGKTLAEVVPANNSVTNAILADMVPNTIKGRFTAGTGDPEDLTAAQTLSILKTAGAYARDNILNTVTHAGGVPTGGIIEQASNANGSYIRFADGTQICHLSRNESITISSAYGGLYSSAPISGPSFPAAFISKPNSFLAVANAPPGIRWLGIRTDHGATVWPIFQVIDAPVRATETVTINYLAIGRWF